MVAIWQQATVLRRNEPETLGQLVERVDRILGRIATAVSDDAVAVVVSHGHLRGCSRRVGSRVTRAHGLFLLAVWTGYVAVHLRMGKPAPQGQRAAYTLGSGNLKYAAVASENVKIELGSSDSLQNVRRSACA